MYYPKSQITTNLYTNGEELYLSSNLSPYKGYYYKLSNGKFFSGKTPQDSPNIELIKGSPVSPPNSGPTQAIGYTDKSGEFLLYPSDFPSTDYPLFEDLKVFLPTYSITFPTEQDYKIGKFKRYFCKKTNELLYLEISKDTYDKLLNNDPSILWQLYLPFSILWQLTGNEKQVYETNRNMTLLAIDRFKLPKFENYLKKDYTKYYKETV